MSRYWNADSDLDWQYGNAPPEEAPQEPEEEPEPMELDEDSAMQEGRVALEQMMAAVEAAIPGHDAEAMLLRMRVRKIALDYADARGSITVRRCNEIWSRK